MKSQTVFHLMADALEGSGARAVMIGSFAVNYYKVTRQTVDVDFLITKEDFARIRTVLEENGYGVKRVHESFAQMENGAAGLMDINFMFVNQETFEKVSAAGSQISIAGRNFVIPSLWHLIALKLHSIKNNPVREVTDFPDVARLVSINEIDVSKPEFKDLCLRYGTGELYERLKGYLRE